VVKRSITAERWWSSSRMRSAPRVGHRRCCDRTPRTDLRRMRLVHRWVQLAA
jgi:hypothetical protein